VVYSGYFVLLAERSKKEEEVEITALEYITRYELKLHWDYVNSG